MWQMLLPSCNPSSHTLSGNLVDLLIFIPLPKSLKNSDISYLKKPPASYLEPAIDIWASLNTILANIKAGVYKNEHEFQTDLLKTFLAVHDGHFRFAPDLLSKALQFRRPVQVVSVSKDGVEVPKIYVKGEPCRFSLWMNIRVKQFRGYPSIYQ